MYRGKGNKIDPDRVMELVVSAHAEKITTWSFGQDVELTDAVFGFKKSHDYTIAMALFLIFFSFLTLTLYH